MNAADTAWILVATALVLMMSLPGLALFYGGLVRARNVLSVFMQCFALAALMSVLWLAVGYSVAFGSDGAALMKADIPAALVAFPARYTHSPFETANLDDIEALTAWMCAFVQAAW